MIERYPNRWIPPLTLTQLIKLVLLANLHILHKTRKGMIQTFVCLSIAFTNAFHKNFIGANFLNCVINMAIHIVF